MSENNLDFPYLAVIPYHVQADTNISDSCKLYYGQIVAFAKKTGYMWATDDQLAEMKGVSKRTIERWHTELESAGFIKRVTANVPVKGQDGAFSWTKKRKIYFNDAFALVKPPLPSTPPAEETIPPEESAPDPAKNDGSLEPDKNGGSYDTAKNGGIIKESLDESLKRQCSAPEAVVVFSSLTKLEIPSTLAVKILNEYSVAEIDVAVERCLRWKTRPSDEVGIMTTLKRADEWSDNPTVEEKEESNLAYLKSLNHLDGKKMGMTNIVVGNKYIEFLCGMKVTIFSVDQPEFKKNIVAYLEYLNRVVESQKK
jgi:hypothetical protein